MTTPGGNYPDIPGSGNADTEDLSDKLANQLKNPDGLILGQAFSRITSVISSITEGLQTDIPGLDSFVGLKWGTLDGHGVTLAAQASTITAIENAYSRIASGGEILVYSTNNTFIVPADAVSVEAWVFGASGGGSSGWGPKQMTGGPQRGAAGGGGAVVHHSFSASALLATYPSGVPIAVGAKGLGGAAQTTNAGANGGDGGTSTFGTSLLVAGGGKGGTITVGTCVDGAGGVGVINGGAGGAPGGSSASGFTIDGGGGGGGRGGGYEDIAGTWTQVQPADGGGSGGQVAGGVAPVNSSTPANGGNGGIPNDLLLIGGGGGAGGAWKNVNTNANPSGHGGNGGFPGGGGGGGGAGRYSIIYPGDSGKGGDGANGVIYLQIRYA